MVSYPVRARLKRVGSEDETRLYVLTSEYTLHHHYRMIAMMHHSRITELSIISEI